MQLPGDTPRLPLSDFYAPPGAPEDWNPKEANPKSWRLFKTAEVIFGHDSTTANTFLVYGRDVLNAIAKFNEPRALRILTIDLDQASDDLEYLIAMLRTQRGQDDYRASEWSVHHEA
jgi:hypothetical protein